MGISEEKSIKFLKRIINELFLECYFVFNGDRIQKIEIIIRWKTLKFGT